MKRQLTKIGMLAAAMAMVGSPSSGSTGTGSVNVKTSNRDAVKNDVKPVAPVMKRNAFGGFGNELLKPAGVFLNQRQYRKRCRQNPHLLRSKKHRSKN